MKTKKIFIYEYGGEAYAKTKVFTQENHLKNSLGIRFKNYTIKHIQCYEVNLEDHTITLFHVKRGDTGVWVRTDDEVGF